MTDDAGSTAGAQPRLLEQRRGLVLGVSRPESVGYHCVRDLQALGARVAWTYRPGRGGALPQRLENPGLPLDVLDEASVERAFSELARRFERLDFLVHGLVHVPSGSLQSSLLELSQDALGVAMEVGVRSLLLTAKHALPLLRRSPAPRIVVLLSPGSDFAIPNYHLVGIVKAALASALRYLAAELGPQGVLCNGVNFSMLSTTSAEQVLGKTTVEQTHTYVTKHSLTKTALRFEHVTSAVGFLASAQCQNLTGEVLTVDGGYSRNYF